MQIIDVNPETKHLTEALTKCKVRILFADGSKFDYDVTRANTYAGNPQDHPYIKDFLNKTKINEKQQILILNEDGTERLGPIEIPPGKLPVIRMRTRGGSSKGVNKFIVIGLVDKNSQVLHFLDRDGKAVVVTSPTETGPDGKIVLIEQELSRL